VDNLKLELKELELKEAPLSCTLSYSLTELQSYPWDWDLLIKSSRAVAHIQYAWLIATRFWNILIPPGRRRFDSDDSGDEEH